MFSRCLFQIGSSKRIFLILILLLTNCAWQKNHSLSSRTSKRINQVGHSNHGLRRKQENVKVKKVFQAIQSDFQKNTEVNQRLLHNKPSMNAFTQEPFDNSNSQRQLSLRAVNQSSAGQLVQQPQVIENQGQNPDFLVNQYYPNTQVSRPFSTNPLPQNINPVDSLVIQKQLRRKLRLKSNVVYSENSRLNYSNHTRYKKAKNMPRKLQVMGRAVDSIIPSKFSSESFHDSEMINFVKESPEMPRLEGEANVIREDTYPALSPTDARITGTGYPRYKKEHFLNPQALKGYEKFDDFRDSRANYENILNTVLELNRAIDNLDIRSRNRSSLVDQRIHQLSATLSNIVKIKKDTMRI